MLFTKQKPAKISAYEAIIKYNITSLPVPIKYPDGIKIFTLQFLAEYHKQNVSDYFKTFGYRGFVCYEPESEQYIIFINGDDPEPLQRWSISASIGCIENHKVKKNDGMSISEVSQYVEDFTYVYTCPDCILKRDNLISTGQIINICKIPFNRASEKNKRLKITLDFKSDIIKRLEAIICNLIAPIQTQFEDSNTKSTG